jgi:hypothetical protein
VPNSPFQQSNAVKETPRVKLSEWYSRFYIWIRPYRRQLLTPTTKGVIKGVIGYFLGSLLTFIPAMRDMIGTSSHMAAISVFFMSPAVSIGQFLESIIYGSTFILFGLLSSYLSLYNMNFWNVRDLHIIGNLSTWLIFVGCVTFILAWIKSRFRDPIVSKSIPNAAIIIYIVICNYTVFVEDTFSSQKVWDLAKALGSGIIINLFVTTTFWPRWEATYLKKDMVTSLESNQKLLHSLIKTFLLVSPNNNNQNNEKSLKTLMNEQTKAFLNLKKRYSASKLEFFFNFGVWLKLGKVVNKLESLGQKMGGLTAGLEAQKELLADIGQNELPYNQLNHRRKLLRRKKYMSMLPPGADMISPTSPYTPYLSPNQMPASPNLDDDKTNGSYEDESGNLDLDITVLYDFIDFVGPHLKSLAKTCKRVLINVSDTYKIKNRSILDPTKDSPIQDLEEVESDDEFHNYNQSTNFQNLKRDLIQSLKDFDTSHNQAIIQLYQRTRYNGKPHEEVFLVYFFVFSLQEFALELLCLLDAVDEFHNYHCENPVLFSLNIHFKNIWSRIKSSFSSFKESLRTSSESKIGSGAFRRDPVQAEHNPNPINWLQRRSTHFWYLLMSLRDPNIVFALKSAVAVLIVSIPAFLDAYQDIYKEFRAAWALITMFLVMSPTVGASNAYGVYRGLGTVIGSFSGYFIYRALSGHQILLPIASSVFAIPCLYLYQYSSIPRVGQMTLLSYNLVALTTYANRHDDDFNLFHYALTRAISVLVGVFAGLITSSWVLPYEARKELRKGLSEFFGNTSLLFSNLVSKFLTIKPIPIEPRSSTSKTPLLSASDSNSYDTESMIGYSSSTPLMSKKYIAMEYDLQVQLAKLRSLLTDTINEPRLKGKFPSQTYKKILDSCQKLLNLMITMRLLMTKDPWNRDIQKDFIIPLNSISEQVTGSILLYFYILSSAVILKTPLPPTMPPASHQRKQLINALRELPIIRSKIILKDPNNQILYYAFVVVLDDLISELEFLGDQMKILFGTITWDLIKD